MRRKIHSPPLPPLIVLIAVLFFSSPLYASLQLEDQAPPLNAKKSWNDDGRKEIEDFRGEMLHLYWWNPGNGTILPIIKSLVEYKEKLKGKPYNQVFVCAGQEKAVDNFFEANDLRITCLSVDNSTMIDAWKIDFRIDTTVEFIVDPDGVIKRFGQGVPKFEDVVSHVKGGVRQVIPNAFEGEAEGARKLFNKGHYAKATKEANAVRENAEATEADKANAKIVLDLIAEHEEAAPKWLTSYKSKREYLLAKFWYDKYSKRFKGMPLEDRLDKIFDGMKKDKNYSKESKCLKAYEKLLDEFNKTNKPKQLVGVFDRIQAFADKNKDLLGGEKASALIKRHKK